MTTLHIKDPSIFSRLYMVRHGESTCNIVNRIAGCLDAPLTFLGRTQAHEASRYHGHLDFDRVYVSPLSRAFETAQIILQDQHLDASKIVTDERLAERDFGSYTLENKSILQRKHGIAEYERAMNADSETMVEGESSSRFKGRVIAFFRDELVPALESGETVLVVSHKYVVELICSMILQRPVDEAYDLRLPNSEFLRGDDMLRYVKNEHRSLNMFYDWIVVNHAWLFCAMLGAGLALGMAGLGFHTPSWMLLLLLIAATTITLTRIELENAGEYLADPGMRRLVLFRYLAIPVLFAGALYWSGLHSNGLLAMIAVFLATPTAIIGMTVSRCLGGLVMPSLAFIAVSSLISVVPFTAILYLFFGGDALLVSVVSLCVPLVTLLVPYLLVKRSRSKEPIRTAKFGDRYAYLAVLLLCLFILLASLRLDHESFAPVGFLAISVAIGLRLLAALLSSNSHVFALDGYISLSYPNNFVVVVVAAMIGNIALEQFAIWFLLPMFLLSAFDGWYARFHSIDASDARLFSLLKITGQPKVVRMP